MTDAISWFSFLMVRFKTIGGIMEFQAEQAYSWLFDNMAEGFAHCRVLHEGGRAVNWVFLSVNKAFTALTGAESVAGKKASDIFPGIIENDRELLEVYDRVSQSGKHEKPEMFIKTFNQWLSLSVYSPASEHLMVLFEVISGRKNHEESIRLELKRAKRLSDIGTLAATVAHEIRNPLAAMQIAAANLKRKIRDENIEKHVHTIEKKIFESENIIENLLAYARVKQPSYAKLDMIAVVNDCLTVAQLQFRRKQVVVKKDFAGEKQYSMEADATQMNEVIQNVVNNAFDAVPENGGVIDVSVKTVGEWVEICVTDNGHGIEGESLDKVFDPFFTTKTRGTGLGLAVSRQIIDRHDGSIELESEPGKGTAVTIMLPRQRS